MMMSLLPGQLLPSLRGWWPLTKVSLLHLSPPCPRHLVLSPKSAHSAGELLEGLIEHVRRGVAVAQQWQGEVELLQKRMARMGRMEEAIERQRQRERAARDTLQRRLLRGALAVWLPLSLLCHSFWTRSC
jgi:hypothetical protein